VQWGILRPMNDLSIITLVAEFISADPIRALGLFGLACVAISMTTDFDLLHLLGFTEVREEAGRETTVA
jgi:hypothetical protein